MAKVYKDPVVRTAVAILTILFIVDIIISSRGATGAKHYPAYFFNIGLYFLLFYIFIWYLFLRKSIHSDTPAKTRITKYTAAIIGAAVLLVAGIIAIVMLAFSGGGL